MSTWNTRFSAKNLSALREASHALTPDERRSLLDHLIGGISGYVDPDSWTVSLAAARTDALRFK